MNREWKDVVMKQREEIRSRWITVDKAGLKKLKKRKSSGPNHASKAQRNKRKSSPRRPPKRPQPTSPKKPASRPSPILGRQRSLPQDIGALQVRARAQPRVRIAEPHEGHTRSRTDFSVRRQLLHNEAVMREDFRKRRSRSMPSLTSDLINMSGASIGHVESQEGTTVIWLTNV